MISKKNKNNPHATASPGGDALCGPPVPEVKNKRTGTSTSTSLVGQIFSVGCWNVRTLLDPGSQCVKMKALDEYAVDIACLSEVRLQSSGCARIKVLGETTHYWLYYSGTEARTGQHGVGIAIKDSVHKTLISWRPVSERIALARFKASPVNVTVVAVYAPTLQADTLVVDDFYKELQSVVRSVPRRDVLIVAGDWNARTGPADPDTTHILGRFGLGRRCENGERLVSFADYNRLVVTNTRFQHPRRHLLTWYSNDGHTANQIDYILVRARWSTSVLDSRAFRGAVTGNASDSDHVLVRAKIRLRLSSHLRQLKPKRFNVKALQDPQVSSALERRLSVELPSVPSSDLDVETRWSRLKTATQNAMQDTLGAPVVAQKD